MSERVNRIQLMRSEVAVMALFQVIVKYCVHLQNDDRVADLIP